MNNNSRTLLFRLPMLLLHLPMFLLHLPMLLSHLSTAEPVLLPPPSTLLHRPITVEPHPQTRPFLPPPHLATQRTHPSITLVHLITNMTIRILNSFSSTYIPYFSVSHTMRIKSLFMFEIYYISFDHDS